MERIGWRRRLNALQIVALALVAGCSPTSFGPTVSSAPAGQTGQASATPEPTPVLATGASPAAGPTSADTGSAALPQLLVLAGTTSPSLQVLQAGGGWSVPLAGAGVTALARSGGNVVLARAGKVEFRPVTAPGIAGQSFSAEWGSPAQSDQLPVAIDATESGKVAVALGGDPEPRFSVLEVRSGTYVSASLSPAPHSPFGPSLAWLDQDRLCLLSTDNMQVSRLAVIDLAGKRLSTLSGVAGIRTFGLSPDRKTLAAVTEQGIYVAPVSVWLSGSPLDVTIPTDASSVYWAPAMDATGTQVAIFAGTEGADGSVTQPRDLVYGLRGGSWQKLLDVSAPFAQARNQVWLT